MMDLRVSAVLLLVFLTGGNPLKCYSCFSLTDTCDGEEETCPAGFSKCISATVHGSIRSIKLASTNKQCRRECEPGTEKLPTGGTVIVKCCDTDLCNVGKLEAEGPDLANAAGSIKLADTTKQTGGPDLANAADGMYKGSVVLLLSPLLFYFLFH